MGNHQEGQDRAQKHQNHTQGEKEAGRIHQMIHGSSTLLGMMPSLYNQQAT